ncbi:uncharacterized protein RAG0_02114 [Rhynchosporium agropyri]|uniref:Uncharacterized protein n=1 Tax=Rhynchosporium agropyri TaxID=914238 RepID=A0A1E1K0B4_9HELO|nr:uncharacterized protein RAG0_02114 [Rhynchosporium agropyri]
MGKPRKQPHVPRPSPLQQVQLTRPISQAPVSPGLVRDPIFWKRFSAAVHASEEFDLERGRSDSTSTVDSKKKGERKRENDWLEQQWKEKRRCRTLCIVITLIVACLISGGAVAGWWFTQGPGR